MARTTASGSQAVPRSAWYATDPWSSSATAREAESTSMSAGASPRAISRITVTSETSGNTKKNQTRAPSSSPTTMKTGTQRSIQGPSSATK